VLQRNEPVQKKKSFRSFNKTEDATHSTREGQKKSHLKLDNMLAVSPIVPLHNESIIINHCNLHVLAQPENCKMAVKQEYRDGS